MGLLDRRHPNPAQVPPAKQRYGVLLVDDEVLNLTALAGLLEDDYRVHVAGNADDALALLADPAVSAGIQVIISDQRMPRMTGIELLSRTRGLHPTIKRILLTGYTDVDAIVGAINQAAVYRYLHKPVEIQQLRLTLTSACEAWQLEEDNKGLLVALRQSYAKLALIDADKTTFLHYLAHETNTPLNWLSAAQAIDRDELGEDSIRMLEYVDQGQERLHGLLGMVLRYFELGGVDLPLRRVDFDLSAWLTGRVGDLQSAHGERLRVQLDMPESLVLATDQALFEEMFVHLLENAMTHALRHGDGPEIDVRVLSRNNEVVVDVYNNGVSPNETTAQQLFEPFFFCGSMHGAKGFGLSLATARAAALALGGDLTFLPEKRRGCSLRLRIPCKMPLPGDHAQWAGLLKKRKPA